MGDKVFNRVTVLPHVSTDGDCTTYTFADGFDELGRPNRWRSTTYCRVKDGGKPSGGGGTQLSPGVSSGVDAGALESSEHPVGAILQTGLTFADPELMAEEEQRLRRRDEALANFGWNAGAHSAETIAAGWQGALSFDVPDVQGARPAGVAVGLAPVSALPAEGRNGFGHLAQGLLFTEEKLRLISDGVAGQSVPYAALRARRAAGAGTDQVNALLYGGLLKWVVNGVAVAAVPYEVRAPMVLDATLYKALDAVDNPRFMAGSGGQALDALAALEEGSLNGLLGALQMRGDALHDTQLVGALAPLQVRLSQGPSADLAMALGRLEMASAHTDGMTATLARMQLRAYEGRSYGSAELSLAPLRMGGGMAGADPDVTYSVLMPSLARLAMTATMPPVMTGTLALPALFMLATSEVSYSELAAPLPGLRMLAYAGQDTPLVYALEAVGCHVPLRPVAYLSQAFVERLQARSPATVQAIMGAQACERISIGDLWSALQTFVADALEQIGAMERVRLVAHDDLGALGGEAWVVNAATRASTRYDRYGFNSFAAWGGRHYGARADGIYVLQGSDDAGRPIASGVALGRHDLGTQALKGIDAVYVGVSSTGALFLKVGDGRSHYTYRARRHDPRMQVQRFDVGRGLRASYFTFELSSDADAFELDSVRFHVLAGQRRI